MKKISIVVPCYNEEETVPLFHKEINKITKKLTNYKFEFVFVNDGSKDKTVEEITKLSSKDKRVALLDFSRNFGKEAGLLAGIKYASGDAVIVMDVDLQDPPELIYEFVKYYEEGYDVVYSRRKNRDGEPPIRSFFAKMFYKLINKMSDVEIVDGARDYRLMSRKAVDSLLELNEHNRFSKGLFMWIGFNSKLVEFEHVDRVAGKTSFSFFKLCSYAIEGIVSFSVFPLKIASYLGLFVSFIAFIFMIYIFSKTLFLGNEVDGWSSIMSVVLFLGGIQLIVLGIIGEYLSKIFGEVKNRPHYIIKNQIDSNIKEK